MTRVFVSGCFDLLHVGHLEFLNYAKNQGDTLTVMLGSDDLITKLKGKPAISENDRLKMLKALRVVDNAFIVKGDMNWSHFAPYLARVSQLGDVLVTGADDKHLAEKKQLCLDLGLKFVVRPLYPLEDRTCKIKQRIKYA